MFIPNTLLHIQEMHKHTTMTSCFMVCTHVYTSKDMHMIPAICNVQQCILQTGPSSTDMQKHTHILQSISENAFQKHNSTHQETHQHLVELLMNALEQNIHTMHNHTIVSLKLWVELYYPGSLRYRGRSGKYSSLREVGNGNILVKRWEKRGAWWG